MGRRNSGDGQGGGKRRARHGDKPQRHGGLHGEGAVEGRARFACGLDGALGGGYVAGAPNEAVKC